MVNNFFLNNSVTTVNGSGGAIFLERFATVVDNIFDGNTALGADATGGAGRIGLESLFERNTVVNNSATAEGGGILFNRGLYTVTNNVFVGNSASHGGGAHGLANSVVTNNTITGNIATVEGGGLWIERNTVNVVISNNVITGNVAAVAGGGLWVQAHAADVTYNTITGNIANVEGGGLWVQLVLDSDSLDLYNNIVWSNSAPSAADIYLDNNGDNSFFASLTNIFNNDFDQAAAGFIVNLPIVIDQRPWNDAALRLHSVSKVRVRNVPGRPTR